MVADEDHDGALFARKVVQCVSLAVGRRKPKLRRRRTESDLGGCHRHLAPPCVRNICESVPKFGPFGFQTMTRSREQKSLAVATTCTANTGAEVRRPIGGQMSCRFTV